MRITRGYTLAVILGLSLAIVGCEGDQGPAGPPGPPGGGGLSAYSYVGGQGAACSHCHATTVNMWETTGHAMASAGLTGDNANDPYCLQCHTTGWDSPVESGGQIDPNNRGPNDEGYDDYFGVGGEEAADRRDMLMNVQCESCHGPMGDDFPGHKPLISFSTRFEGEGENRVSTSLCSPCHAIQLEEWDTSGHAFFSEDGMARLTIEEFNEEHYAHNPSCDGCHTSDGFIRQNDPRYATYDFPELQSFIGCPTCHDPHAGEEISGNEAQLRNLDPVEVEFHPGLEPGDVGVPRMAGKGSGQTCAQCHHARRNTSNVLGQIANGYAHFGPHGSPQMDMYIGYGSYEIPGFDYEYAVDRMTTHNGPGFPKACVTCHMALSEDSPQHRLHSFAPNLSSCTGCHGEITTPDISFSGGDGRQTFTKSKMDELAVALGYLDRDDFLTNWDSQAEGVQAWEREAAYALVFVENDGSYGVHNPFYSEALLQNAIDHVNAQNAKMALGR